ncbi:MAG: pitrilysin family protein [Chloroflexota bacterium]|nr:pitrilysin family protein [Chloroflexota bacterium]
MKFQLATEKTTLDNGLRVLTCAMPHTYSVGVGFYLSVGSRYEEASTAGAAHFLEHMIFKGTEKRPSPEAIAVELEGNGGLFNASTGLETTILWAKMQQGHLSLAIDILSDMLRNSLLVQEEIEKERRVILEEISSSQDIPDELVGLVAREFTWPDHPLGWDVAGTPESVAGLARETLEAFLDTHYNPKNLVLSVAGDIQHDEVVDLAHSRLGDWQTGLISDFLPAPKNGTDPAATVVTRKVEQTHLQLHLPGISRLDRDRYHLALLNVILGEGMSSRLFLDVRERLGLAYAVDSYISFLADTGVIGVYAAVNPEKVDEALHAILVQLQRLRDEQVEEKTLNAAKEYVKGRLLMSMEDTLSVAGWGGRQEIQGGPIDSVEQTLEQVRGITVEDLQSAADRLFKPEGARLAIVGPHKEADAAHFNSILNNGTF